MSPSPPHRFSDPPRCTNRLFLAFFAAVLITQAGTAESFRFKSRTVNDGLSQSTVTSIAEDQMGFLWFGTLDGLNRYDGYEFKIFRNDPDDTLTVSGNYISCLAMSRTGAIWVGTWRNGLNRFDPSTETFRRYELRGREGPDRTTNYIFSLCEDSDGILWAGTHNGLFALHQDGSVRSFLPDSSDDSSLVYRTVRSIMEDSQGVLWIGTTRGLCRLTKDSKKNGRFIRYEPDQNDPSSIAD